MKRADIVFVLVAVIVITWLILKGGKKCARHSMAAWFQGGRMPNRTVYLSEEQVQIWEDVRMYAKASDVGVATLLLDLLEKHVPLDTLNALEEQRNETKKLVKVSKP